MASSCSSRGQTGGSGWPASGPTWSTACACSPARAPLRGASVCMAPGTAAVVAVVLVGAAPQFAAEAVGFAAAVAAA